MWSKSTRPIFNFNPRTHVGCDPECLMTKDLIDNFNPRTHVGCDLRAANALQQWLISIHAPTWGATPNKSGFDLSHEFQSTHPRGVRPHIKEGIKHKWHISIHAPTWGATVKPSNGWLLGHKDNEFANENIIIINSVNIT